MGVMAGEELFREGFRLWEAGDLEGAVRLYRAVEGPLKAEALVNLGAVLGEMGRLEEAIECFHRVLALEDAPVEQRAKALLNEGVALGQLGRFAEAVDRYDAALALEPGVEILLAKGFALRQLGQTAEAVACYDQVLATPDLPADLVAKTNINKGFSLASEPSAALACFDLVLDLADAPPGQRAMAFLNKGALLGQVGQLDEALACLEEALAVPDGGIDPERTRELMGVLRARLSRLGR